MKNVFHGLRVAWKHPRWRLALLVAAVSDALGWSLGLVPPVQWALDGITALILLRIIGFSWPLLLALAVEAVPALELFPTWILVVLVQAGMSGDKPGKRFLP